MLAPPTSDTKAPMYANGTRRHHHAVRESTQLLVGSVSFSLSDFFPPLSFIFLVDAVYLNILFDLFSYCHILFSLYLFIFLYIYIECTSIHRLHHELHRGQPPPSPSLSLLLDFEYVILALSLAGF